MKTWKDDYFIDIGTSTNSDRNNCRQYFDVKLHSTLGSDRVRRFEKKFAECKVSKSKVKKANLYSDLL